MFIYFLCYKLNTYTHLSKNSNHSTKSNIHAQHERKAQMTGITNYLNTVTKFTKI